MILDQDETDYFNQDIDHLLAIYNEKTTFAKEYQHMLAESLLKLSSFEVDQQITHLEILKTKFGEFSMTEAQVINII